MSNTKEQLRLEMPSVAMIVDEYRAIFGEDIKVLWAKEGGIEKGRIPKLKSVPYNDTYLPPELPKTSKTKKRK